jgi:YD repeat-containing protein
MRTQFFYDGADRLIEVQSAYGTSAQQTTFAQSFTENGLQATLTDANGNVTTYEYDGVDRLERIRFPNASGGGSSSSDYEQFSYNANGMVTQRRLRDGGLINFGYDNLSRVTSIDAPSGTAECGPARMGAPGA